MTAHRHPTASVFLLGRPDGAWRLALVAHPRLGRWMLPGGHVEPGEDPVAAAHREVREEAGHGMRLLGAPDRPWLAAYPVGPDSRFAGDHVHDDHLFVAVATGAVGAAELPSRWAAAADLHRLRMFPDTRALGAALLDAVEGLDLDVMLAM